MSIAFNGKSLKEYINFVFETLTTKTKLQPPMMIDCEELSTLEEIVMMTLIVCSTQFQDSIIAIGDRMITPENARENLEELVARRNPDLTVIDTLEIDPDKTMIFEKLSSQATNDMGWSVALLTWIDNLCKKVNTIILIETDFKDLKMNLRKKVKLPTTINKFFKLHIADILGGVNIFRSKIIKFIADNCLDENLTKSKEDNWYENWKGLGKSETATDYDWASDYVNVSNKVEQNDSVSVSENHIDFDCNTNLPESKSNQNDSVITFEKHDDHNYSATEKSKKREILNLNLCKKSNNENRNSAY
ncbi:hypothetical protein PV328_010306 [Microctonus aethiopoides]|uniref:Uncharacterized protein n=1 Tax=Microctonus aethiopoides TaxID=144406 RepID=A0AA39C7S4_9HYME|nr:hypothetical protein PV328_010306 [Microctonus aethiopoides]